MSLRRGWRRLTWWWPRNMVIRPWSREWWLGYRYHRLMDPYRPRNLKALNQIRDRL